MFDYNIFLELLKHYLKSLYGKQYISFYPNSWFGAIRMDLSTYIYCIICCRESNLSIVILYFSNYLFVINFAFFFPLWKMLSVEQALFLYKFKLGNNSAETGWNVNLVFEEGTFNDWTIEAWFQWFQRDLKIKSNKDFSQTFPTMTIREKLWKHKNVNSFSNTNIFLLSWNDEKKIQKIRISIVLRSALDVLQQYFWNVLLKKGTMIIKNICID